MEFNRAGQYILRKLKNELPPHLSYHSVEHVKDVYAAADSLCSSEQLTDYERKLVLTAAWYHDSGFLKGAKDHEEESCRIAREVLPQFGYTTEEIEQISRMIMATKIPQSPRNHLEQVLADADLDYLGRDDFWVIGDKLFNELLVSGFIHTEEEWNHLQISFLESHHYFTHTAIAWRQKKKKEHLENIKAKLK